MWVHIIHLWLTYSVFHNIKLNKENEHGYLLTIQLSIMDSQLCELKMFFILNDIFYDSYQCGVVLHFCSPLFCYILLK